MSSSKGFQNDDDAQLAAMGHKAELNRNFSMLSMLGLAFAILNTRPKSIPKVSLQLVSVTYLPPSRWPSSCPPIPREFLPIVTGGQIGSDCGIVLEDNITGLQSVSNLSLVSIVRSSNILQVSWEKWVPSLSWITGWANVSGWTYEAQRWHQFLLYVAYNIIGFLVNSLMNKGLPLVTKGAFIWSITGFAVISITILACSSPNYSSGEFVFGDFINTTGWPDGLAWLLGLLQGGLGLTGFDGVAHMIEEIPDASVVGPRIMIYCVSIGCFTGLVFLIVLLFVAGDITQVINSTAGCLLQIFKNATANNAGAICLLMFPLVCILFATITIMATSSRMIYAFARDGGLPASPFFSKVHDKLKVPLNALYLTNALVIIFGLIFLGSSSAFNAIVSSSVVMLDISYGIPIAINCLRGRKMLPERPFVLPNAVGWTVNLIALAYISLTTVLFLFPPEIPVTGSNMNYCVAAFGIILIISTFQWIVDGRKNFTGPRVDVAVLSGEVAVGSSEPVEGTSPSKDAMQRD
ncbi:hypothetical protein ATEG_01687 [Aspergillus terreus NIH2624]|uniref:Amino acid permease/ SLC12A domain-containing protein n=1 Tax=Aspergillus terreus (strain NIH 2624 / FGSC A1156) TaxID=341663 RepID=Q0CX97_ASPTN|nr:uncharacterized protein ATEG_01687 [Aspergillus terreus NIH2624]EAU38444.1 hypothetical protein ATEG_01687 [Aspergillus terreus NIH2624]